MAAASAVHSSGSAGGAAQSGPGGSLLSAAPAAKALPRNPAALAGAQRPLRVPSSIGEVLLCSGGSGALPGCGASRVCAAGLPAEKAGWERG